MLLPALRHDPADAVTEVDRRLTELTEKLRRHSGDAALEAVLRQRIDALLDARLRLVDREPSRSR